MHPDPDFPTVKFPNPEEKGALDLAIKCANLSCSQIIFANDPDADRFAMAEKIDGSFYQFVPAFIILESGTFLAEMKLAQFLQWFILQIKLSILK